MQNKTNDMKKLMLWAICAMAVMISCKNQGQTAPADSNDSMAVAAVIDSIIEENDTTPLPMFLIGNDGQYMQMLYWTSRGAAEDRRQRRVFRVLAQELGVPGDVPS